MSASSPTNTPVQTLPKWNAGLSISRVLLDFVEEIDYENGGFVQRNHVVTGPRPAQGTPLSTDGMRSLLVELESQRDQQPSGAAPGPLNVFIDVLGDALGDCD